MRCEIKRLTGFGRTLVYRFDEQGRTVYSNNSFGQLGTGDADDKAVMPGDEFGCRPFTTTKFALLTATSECTVIRLPWELWV